MGMLDRLLPRTNVRNLTYQIALNLVPTQFSSSPDVAVPAGT